MVKEKQPVQFAADEFANLLLSFNSSNKIQLNVINIISETMCSKADEIAQLIMKTYEQNAELGVVIDQLSVRNSLYKQLFEKYAGQRVHRAAPSGSPVQERADTHRDIAEESGADEHGLSRTNFAETGGADAGEYMSALHGSKPQRERKNTRRRGAGAIEGGTRKRNIKASGVKAEGAAGTHKAGGLRRVDERNTKVSSLAEQERHVKDAIPANKGAGQTQTANSLMDNRDLGHDEIGRKRMKITHGFLGELELIVLRGLEVEEAAKTINTQLLDETLFKTIQCKICGLRYSPDEKEVLSLHLADHQRRIRASEAKAVVSRDYMCRKSEWLVSKLNLPSIRADRKAIACSKPQTCKICRNKICLSWCDDAGQWILEDAIEISGSQYCHRKCVE